ncbi:MAG: DUF2505 family protein [Myxococcales bacterium]|nr:DUF2505 family protein [Myxococcales bacterium]
MTTHIETRHEFDLTPAEFDDRIRWSDAYREALYASLGFRYEVVESDRATGARQTRVWPAADVPAPLRKMFGDDFHFTEQGRYDEARRRYEFTVTPSVASDRVQTTGVERLEALDGGRCLRVMEVNVEASLFGLGKVLEAFVARSTKQSYDDDAAFIRAYVRDEG